MRRFAFMDSVSYLPQRFQHLPSIVTVLLKSCVHAEAEPLHDSLLQFLRMVPSRGKAPCAETAENLPGRRRRPRSGASMLG